MAYHLRTVSDDSGAYNVIVSLCVCVFFTLNRSSTRRHPAHPVSVLILHPRKISSVVTPVPVPNTSIL